MSIIIITSQITRSPLTDPLETEPQVRGNPLSSEMLIGVSDQPENEGGDSITSIHADVMLTTITLAHFPKNLQINTQRFSKVYKSNWIIFHILHKL